MNKKVFLQAVSTGLAIATVGSFAPFSAIAQTETSQKLANALTVELTQMPETRDSVATLPKGTIVFAQTAQYAVRVYSDDNVSRLNLYNKQTRKTELLGVATTVESTDTGTIYRYTGPLAVEVVITNSGEQTLIVNGTSQQASGTITGTVSYLPRIALSPNAVIEVSLVDISRADAPAITLASAKTISGGRQVPLPFELLYDVGQIDSRYTYAVQSRITVDGELQFVSTTQFPVITNGNPTEIQVQVDPVDLLANQSDADETGVEDQLVGTAWQLEQIQYNNDTLIEATPGEYTIEFMEDRQLSIRADCNQASGSFTADSSSLSIDLGPTTLAACGLDSVDSEYLQSLNSAAIYFFQDGKLFIDLQADTGTMQFSKME